MSVSHNLEWGIYMDTRKSAAGADEPSDGHRQSEGSRGSKRTDEFELVRAMRSTHLKASCASSARTPSTKVTDGDQYFAGLRGFARGPIAALELVDVERTGACGR